MHSLIYGTYFHVNRDKYLIFLILFVSITPTLGLL